ncbi:sensor domain-containing phosphodiesterase [Pseudomonas japonica]|uniref:sensor domain-containing phosphodiesterase n=1 Tax=Pseudomonas japonica TaxID=256466 RepID=UPI0015E32A2A|nr:EAL domain-containing protein [Pseudomonas japonica]MBA1244821.1 EAL domain-containing protein [Pseudomonas japonica]MBA1287102.1 EAL domain-containing protein [Pseudomonas japonica]
MSLTSVVALKTPPAAGEEGIDKVLRALRTHLDMDVAFVSRFRERDRVFTHVDARGVSPLKAGDVLPLEAGYCKKVVDGRLPQLIPNTAALPLAMAIPETRALPIGAHISVPVRLSNGRLYGTLCCFSGYADTSLGERDLSMLKVFAELIADRLEVGQQAKDERLRKHRVICAALAKAQPNVVYQPIVDLARGQICGWESLARFTDEPMRSPDLWFRDAAEAGLGLEMELRAVEKGLAGLSQLPAGHYLSLNCSPQLFLSGRLARVLATCDPSRLVLELTEHSIVSDYGALVEAIEPLRSRGLRLAIDDAGAGYASMRHILQLRPDIIKLDMALTQGIHGDSQQRAMASALIAFARETNCSVVAEGVETLPDLLTLRRLGADKVQGYLTGRPMPLALATLWQVPRLPELSDPKAP